jgi:hypothetical protein
VSLRPHIGPSSEKSWPPGSGGKVDVAGRSGTERARAGEAIGPHLLARQITRLAKKFYRKR